MNMLAYYKQAFSRITDFNGRSSRSEFWYFHLMNIIVVIVLFVIKAVLSRAAFGMFFLVASIIGSLYYVVILLPSISISIRRLHDIGKSGWMLLLGFVPYIGSIIVFGMHCLASEPKANKWGPAPGTTNNDSLQDALLDIDDDIF